MTTWSEPRECVGCGNTTEMMIDDRANLTCPICGHAVMADFAVSEGAPTGPLNINVQFEPGGRVYTYERMTLEQFGRKMHSRYLTRGEMPHRAWFVDAAGEETEITFKGQDR